MHYLLIIHILAGMLALMAAVSAVVSFKGKKVQIIAGRTYFWGMTIIFLTSIPMSIVSGKVFLFLIAIFSFYLAYAGMRFARNRTGIANIFDWVAVGLMILSGMVMWCLAIFYFINNNSQYITLIIFGFIAISLGYTDFRGYRNKSAIGKQRIARHLTNMLAGTIAVITAVLVTNIYIEPVFILWKLPTKVITPLIFWWNRKYTVSNKAI